MAITDAVIEAAPWIPADTFAARLALIRNHLGWNVKEAADACGLNDQSWRNWEAGKMPRDYIATCDAIAAATGCSALWLIQGTQNRKKMIPSDRHLWPVETLVEAVVTPVPELPFPPPLTLVRT